MTFLRNKKHNQKVLSFFQSCEFKKLFLHLSFFDCELTEHICCSCFIISDLAFLFIYFYGLMTSFHLWVQCCVSLIFFPVCFLIWLTIVLWFFIMASPSFGCHFCVMLPLEVRALCLALFFVGLCCAVCVALFTCHKACCLVLFFFVGLCCAVCVALSWGILPCAFFWSAFALLSVALLTCHQACWPSLQSTSVSQLPSGWFTVQCR